MAEDRPIVDFDFSPGDIALFSYINQESEEEEQTFCKVEDEINLDSGKYYIVNFPSYLKNEIEIFLPEFIDTQKYKIENHITSLVDPEELEPPKRIIKQIK